MSNGSATITASNVGFWQPDPEFPLTARAEAFWVAFGQAGLLVGGLVLLRVQTELLQPDTYAQLALAMTLFSFGQVVVYGGLNQTITRLFAIAPRYGGTGAYRICARRRFVQASIWWSMALIVLAGLAWAAGHEEWATLIVVVLPYSLVNGALSACVAYGNAARARRLVGLHQAADAILKVALVYLAAQTLGVAVPILFGAYAAACLLVLASLAFWLRTPDRPAHHSDDTAIQQVFSRFADPIYLWAPFTWILLVADRWALQSFGDTHALAIYVVAAQMTLGPVRIGMSAILRFWSPRLFDGIEVDENTALNDLWRATIWALGLTAFICVLVTLFRDQISHILLAPDYQSASELLPWLVLAAGLSAGAELLVLRLFGTMNSAALIRPRIVTAVLGGAMIFLGAWHIGVWGVVIAQLLQSGLFLSWIMIQARFPRTTPA